ncbi:DUF2973 domain-containing protein [Cyanobium sp. NIES-981]|uniref:DUF2973 domain-containing protein n=1 Tax=Cyanobium sp. NIES-981 TaxID=1851505 RepID=UPI0007DCBB22|nr:DUF2973 domain-containing protein [Cyanobium sp. NIES-981]SBO44771.1 conserved protein of unknown function [Cyanobium sp. NIES-981]
MNALLSQLFPILYGACFLVLLWQAFRVMGQGFKAVPRPGDGVAPGSSSRPSGPAQAEAQDRTGRLTIHPELLDAEGQLTREDLLTVRFSGDNERPSFPGEAG